MASEPAEGQHPGRGPAPPRRVGPVESGRAALTIGNPRGRHLELNHVGAVWLGYGERESVPIGEIADVELDLHCHWWPFARGQAIWAFVLSGLGLYPSTQPLQSVVVTARDGQVDRRDIDGHSLLGYRRRDAVAAQQLVRQHVGRAGSGDTAR